MYRQASTGGAKNAIDNGGNPLQASEGDPQKNNSHKKPLCDGSGFFVRLIERYHSSFARTSFLRAIGLCCV